jgi:hypothetical protein
MGSLQSIVAQRWTGIINSIRHGWKNSELGTADVTSRQRVSKFGNDDALALLVVPQS